MSGVHPFRMNLIDYSEYLKLLDDEGLLLTSTPRSPQMTDANYTCTVELDHDAVRKAIADSLRPRFPDVQPGDLTFRYKRSDDAAGYRITVTYTTTM